MLVRRSWSSNQKDLSFVNWLSGHRILTSIIYILTWFCPREINPHDDTITWISWWWCGYATIHPQHHLELTTTFVSPCIIHFVCSHDVDNRSFSPISRCISFSLHQHKWKEQNNFLHKKNLILYGCWVD